MAIFGVVLFGPAAVFEEIQEIGIKSISWVYKEILG